MSYDTQVEKIRHLIAEGYGKGNLAAVEEMLLPTYRDHEEGMPATQSGLKTAIASLRAAFPDLKCSIEDIVSERDRVCCRLSVEGTHKGTFMGHAATDRSFTIAVCEVYRFEGDKIAEHWGVTDRFSLHQQLGLLDSRSPGPPK